MKTFADLHHLKRLRDDLWKTPVCGQAVVMVGAGFSLNAESIPGDHHSFSTWPELANEMFDALYLGKGIEHSKRRLQATGGISLASEYEAAFGRMALDQLLSRTIPDNKYIPGTLHRLLIELPWADIFTTNYDTLLERTPVDERYYQLILSAEDLPGSSQPRIVKLHGSFPSQRPFVITAEDYRTYPAKCAPFVNTVQQALMENTLVLIGFSGDDPNFYYWSGWVRDHLGETAPRIYLCGLLNLSDPKKRLLESRGVIPIDLAPVVETLDPVPGKSRHALALEWMLLSLKRGKPQNPLHWPQAGDNSVAQPTHLPALMEPSCVPIESEPLHPQPGLPASVPPIAPQLTNLFDCWKQARETYPGWIIAPHDTREHLWNFTHYWIEPVLHQGDQLGPKAHLLLLHELNWRLEHGLVPLFLDWTKKIENVLNQINIKTFSDEPPATAAEHFSAGAPELEEAWLNLAFAVAREAREDFDKKRHDDWMQRILPMAQQKPDWLSRWHYESCLHSLWRLDPKEVLQRVQNWSLPSDLVLWQIRRASILAEIGEVAEAERICSEMLARIRSGLRGREVQIELMSIEGWCMRLLQSLRPLSRGFEEERSKFRDRWNQLAIYRCSPWQEIQPLDLELGSAAPPLEPTKIKKRGFDPWSFSTSYRSGDDLRIFLPAFALLRIFEEAGSPLRAGFFNLSSDGFVNACRWITPMAPFWSLAMLLRAGKKDALLESFDRVRCATLSPPEITTLWDWLKPAIQSSVNSMSPTMQQGATNLSRHVMEGLVELLSRICMRLSREQLDEVFQLAFQLHTLPVLRLDPSLNDITRPLFRRLFDASSPQQLLSWLPTLLSAPIVNSDDAAKHLSGDALWPDPMESFPSDQLTDSNTKGAFDKTLISSQIDFLLKVTRQDTGEARARAVIRLEKCFEANIFSQAQREAFGLALWSQIDDKTGLPARTSYYPHAFLSLPSPDINAAKEAVKKHLLSQTSPRYILETVDANGKKQMQYSMPPTRGNPIVFLVTSATNYPQENGKGSTNRINWNTDEAITLLKKVADWWDADKGILKVGRHFMDTSEGFRPVFSQIIPFLRKVVIPRLSVKDQNEWNCVNRLFTELESNGFSVLPALPAVLHAHPDQANAVVMRIRMAFQRGTSEDVKAAAEAVRIWCRLAVCKLISPIPDDLNDELVNRVAERRQPELDFSIGQIAQIVRDSAEAITQRQIEALCRGLEHLKEETQLPDPKERITVDGAFPPIPVTDRPDYRCICAWLAFELFKLHRNRGLEIPAVLSSWNNICTVDSLPEVRHEWRLN